MTEPEVVLRRNVHYSQSSDSKRRKKIRDERRRSGELAPAKRAWKKRRVLAIYDESRR